MSSERSRWIALYVLCTGMLMIVLDVTVVNVALPYIQTDLGFSSSSLAWVVNAYLIAFGGLLLLAGRLGDLLGRRRVFLAGLAIFTVSSVVCGLATNEWTLVVARFIQGAGGALTSSVILGMIVTMFPDDREQARAIGVFAFVASAGGAVGLLAGGVLTQAINWHWIFFINVPIGIATAVLARRYVPADSVGVRVRGIDVIGAVLVTGALMLGVYTIVSPAADYGWSSGRTLAFAVVSVLLLIGFIAREATAARPLMPLRIFRSRNVTGANLIQVLGAAGMFGTFFLGALYVQKVLGYDPVQIGFAFLPVSVLMGLISVRYSERLIGRFGARRLAVAGMALDRDRARVARVDADARCVLAAPVPGVDAHRARRRHRVPAADGSGHVGGDSGGRGPRVRAGQYDRPGRGSARVGGAGDGVVYSHVGADRGRSFDGGRADRGIRTRLLDLGCAGRPQRRGRGRRAPRTGRRAS